MIDRTVKQAATHGIATVKRSPGTRILCKKCWTSHYRSGQTREVCSPGLINPISPDELAYIIDRARKQRIEEDIQAYSARKARS